MLRELGIARCLAPWASSRWATQSRAPATSTRWKPLRARYSRSRGHARRL